ncbi:MAG: hypothetical protein CAPSK01_002979 [Candidatus Accumulibacter vicinus]|uniref:Uncharacterized protein n=1 Tax=Candidatus Accumulibacter vicinus TaxID=2954382 RepID=A0A084XYJ2_9PROT|nr:MAG: hypothetical protein CAPSK01_002979 [Candidatus Accumulibacter vicinus]
MPVVGREDVEQQRRRGTGEAIEHCLAACKLSESRTNVFDPCRLGIDRPEYDIDGFGQLAKQFLALIDGQRQLDSILQFATAAHQVESEQCGEQEASDENRPVRLGEGLGTPESMGGNADDRPVTVADGNPGLHAWLILVVNRHPATGCGSGTRLQPTGIKVKKLLVTASRIVPHQNFDPARLKQIDGNMHEFLNVEDAHHESQRISLPADTGRGSSAARVAGRIDWQHGVDHRHRRPARLREVDAAADRDVATFPGPLQQCRKFNRQVQVDALGSRRLGARSGKKHRHARWPGDAPLVVIRRSGTCWRSPACCSWQRLLRSVQQRGPQQAMDVGTALEDGIGKNPELLLVDPLRGVEQSADFQEGVEPLVDDRMHGLNTVAGRPLEFLEMAGLQLLTDIPR